MSTNAASRITQSRLVRSCVMALLALAFGAECTGCAHVKPYERGKLAHRMMTTELEGPAASHTLAVHEGATGGGSLAESGCGCN
jgi:hypothetical protein